MSQPTWKLLYSTDCERVFTDETGIYDPEIEIADEVNDAPARERFIVHRFPLERFKVLPQADLFADLPHLVPLAYDATWSHPAASYAPWFARHFPSIAATCGTTPADLIDGLTSADPVKLASAYNAIVGHFGAHEFDSYPLTMSEHALNRRWERQDGRDPGPGPFCAECGERVTAEGLSTLEHEDPDTDEDHAPILDE